MEELYFLAFVLVLLAVFLIFRVKKTAPKSDKIFIIGDVNSGKTALLYYLANKNNDVPTTHSMEVNEASLEINGRQINIIDVPGHSYSKQIFLQRLPEAQKIVFMVDASNVTSIPTTADLLYNILISKAFQKRNPRVLIVLNKQDHVSAYKIPDFEIFFSREIEKIKRSRKAVVADQQDGVHDNLKYDVSSFSFENYSNIKICVGSVKQEQCQEIEKFLSQ